MKKRVLSTLLILALLVTLSPSLLAVHADDSVAITSTADFLTIRDNPAGNYVITVPELDFAGVSDFTPFDTFTGSLTCSAPGGKCTLKNLTIHCANASTGAGLFRYLCGTVDGLIIDASCSLVDTTNAHHIGMIAGYAGAGGKISNCINYANVTGDTAWGVAGILGTAFAKNGTNQVTNCINYGDITNADAYAAGIVALSNAASNTVQIQNCANYGAITSGASNAGGIFSQVENKTGITVQIEDCINSGDIRAKVYAGGILGSAAEVTYQFTITRCLNYGFITSENSAGGIFANSNTTGANGSITLCINYGTIYQTAVDGSQAGGIAGYLKPAANGSITIQNNINYGRVSTMDNIPKSQSAGILTRVHCNSTTVNILGNVNYGLILQAEGQTGARAPIVTTYSGTSTKAKAENNFSAETESFTTVTGVSLEAACGTLIDDTTLSLLNETYPDVFATDAATGTITLKWAAEKGHSAADSTAIVPRCVGYQASAVVDGSYKVRFVSAIQSLYAKEIGYTIVATYEGGSKTFEKSSKTVYRELLATDSSGTMEALKALDKGGAFFYALSIEDIPTSIGAVTFTIQPYCITASGETVYGQTQSATVQQPAN